MSGFNLKLGLGFIGIVAALSLIYVFTYRPTEQKVKLPKCAQGQTAEFVVFHPENADKSRNAAKVRYYNCGTNGKWQLDRAYEDGAPVTAEQP